MNNNDFSSHPVFISLEQVIKTYRDKETKKLVELNLYDIFTTQLNYTKERLNISIPALVLKTDLDNINTQLTRVVSETANFLSNKNAGHLTNVGTYLDAVMTTVRNLPIPIKGKFDFSRKVAGFEELLSTKMSTIETRTSNLSIELKSINDTIAKRKTELKVLESKISQKITAFDKDFDTQKKTMVSETDAVKTDILKNASTIVLELENKLKEAKNLLDIIGNVGVTGNYQKIANNHKEQANKWRWIALFFMVILIGALLFTIYHITNSDFNWQVTLIRILAFSALLYPATYASKEAAKHRNLETINRKSELELASINPFIESLPDEKKQVIKEKLVEKFFGNNIVELEKGKNKEELVSIGGLEKIMNMLMKIWNK